MNVVICTEDEVVSFLVDNIGDVVEPDEDAFEMPPQTLSEDIRDLINGVYKLDEQVITRHGCRSNNRSIFRIF